METIKAFRKRSPIRVIICLITMGAFLFNIAAYDLAFAARTSMDITAAGGVKPESPQTLKTLNVETFILPEYLGYIKDLYKGNSGKTAIHIQDAHCNYGCQRKVAEIISHLNKNYGIKVINLEGGARDYDLSVFTDIADRKTRDKVSDFFVKEGLVNGAEYFAINSPQDVIPWGIETPQLYMDNLNIYREMLQHKDRIDKDLASVSHILNNLKGRIYPPELLEFDKRYSQYKAGNLEFKDYLNYLMAQGKSKAINIKELTSIYLLNQVFEEEKNIDFRKANNQRDDLIDRLQKKLSKRALEELVAKTVSYKQEIIQPKDFYSYLVNKARSVNIDLKDFPELAKYIAYISVYGAMDKTKMMAEMGALEEKVKDALCQNEDQKRLSVLSKNLVLLKNIFAISMSKEDYRYYKDNEASFDMRNYTSFINKEAPRYKITATLDKDIGMVDGQREKMNKFYEYSFKRDEAFLKNMKFDVSMARPVMVITGGFHTENLCELFRKNNISYISIMPNFANAENYQCPYFNLLAGKETGMVGKLYTIISAASSIQIASMLSKAIANDVWNKADIDAFEAAVFIQDQAAKGRKIEIMADGKPIFSHGEGQRVEMSINRLLYNVHEKEIDALIEEAYKTPGKAEAVSTADRNNAAARIEKIADQSTPDNDKKEALKTLARQIRDGEIAINFVDVGKAGLEEHPGGRGIHINSRYKDRAVDLIVHGAIGAITRDDVVATAAEKNAVNLSALLASTEFLPPIWEVAPEERPEAARDYAQMAPGEIDTEAIANKIIDLEYQGVITNPDTMWDVKNVEEEAIAGDKDPITTYVNTQIRIKTERSRRTGEAVPSSQEMRQNIETLREFLRKEFMGYPKYFKGNKFTEDGIRCLGTILSNANNSSRIRSRLAKLRAFGFNTGDTFVREGTGTEVIIAYVDIDNRTISYKRSGGEARTVSVEEFSRLYKKAGTSSRPIAQAPAAAKAGLPELEISGGITLRASDEIIKGGRPVYEIKAIDTQRGTVTYLDIESDDLNVEGVTVPRGDFMAMINKPGLTIRHKAMKADDLAGMKLRTEIGGAGTAMHLVGPYDRNIGAVKEALNKNRAVVEDMALRERSDNGIREIRYDLGYDAGPSGNIESSDPRLKGDWIIVINTNSAWCDSNGQPIDLEMRRTHERTEIGLIRRALADYKGSKLESWQKEDIEHEAHQRASANDAWLHIKNNRPGISPLHLVQLERMSDADLDYILTKEDEKTRDMARIGIGIPQSQLKNIKEYETKFREEAQRISDERKGVVKVAKAPARITTEDARKLLAKKMEELRLFQAKPAAPVPTEKPMVRVYDQAGLNSAAAKSETMERGGRDYIDVITGGDGSIFKVGADLRGDEMLDRPEGYRRVTLRIIKRGAPGVGLNMIDISAVTGLEGLNAGVRENFEQFIREYNKSLIAARGKFTIQSGMTIILKDGIKRYVDSIDKRTGRADVVVFKPIGGDIRTAKLPLNMLSDPVEKGVAVIVFGEVPLGEITMSHNMAKPMGLHVPTFKVIEDLAKRQKEFEKIFATKRPPVSTIAGIRMSVIEADLGESGGAAYRFPSSDGVQIIVLNINRLYADEKGEPLFREFALDHEIKEIKLQVQHPEFTPWQIHVLASAQQAAEFMAKNKAGILPYHLAQLSLMDNNGLQDIVSENRAAYYSGIETYLSPAEAAAAKEYEKRVNKEAQARLITAQEKIDRIYNNLVKEGVSPAAIRSLVGIIKLSEAGTQPPMTTATREEMKKFYDYLENRESVLKGGRPTADGMKTLDMVSIKAREDIKKAIAAAPRRIEVPKLPAAPQAPEPAPITEAPRQISDAESARIFADNVKMLTSDKFKRAFSGGATLYGTFSYVGIVVDQDGRIIEIGNTEDLRGEVRDKYKKDIYNYISLNTLTSNSPYNYVVDIPASRGLNDFLAKRGEDANRRLIRSINAYNASRAAYDVSIKRNDILQSGSGTARRILKVENGIAYFEATTPSGQKSEGNLPVETLLRNIKELGTIIIIRAPSGVLTDSSMNLIGKFFDADGNIVTELNARLDNAGRLVVTKSDGKEIFDENGKSLGREVKLGIGGETKVTIKAAEGGTERLKGNEKEAAGLLLQRAGTARVVDSNPYGLLGIADNNGTLYLAEGLIDSPIARFHEAGEYALAKNNNLVPKGVTIHTFLRGCGKDVRDVYDNLTRPEDMPVDQLLNAIKEKMGRTLTPSEENLIRYNAAQDRTGRTVLYGLQDLVFGEEANEELSVKIAGIIETPVAAVAPVAMPAAEIAAVAAEKIAERSSAVVEAFNSSNGKDDIIKIIVGVPSDMNKADVQPTRNKINRTLARAGFGKIEDNNQIITFEIDLTSPEKTKLNQADAMKKALAEVGDGRVVTFSPHIDKGPQIAETTQEEFKNRPNIIVVPDAYTDCVPEKNVFPDITLRAALGRTIAFCRKCEEKNNTEGVQEALAIINDLLGQVVSGYVPVDKLAKLLNVVLRIKPVDYKDIMEWKRSQEAVATAL